MELRPGDELDLDLYWRALQPLDRDYSIFVHLTDGDQLLQAQQDTFPGAGNSPTLGWSTDVVMPDSHRITIPETAPSPSRLMHWTWIINKREIAKEAYDEAYMHFLPPSQARCNQRNKTK